MDTEPFGHPNDRSGLLAVFLTLGGKLGLPRAQEAIAALPTLVIDQVAPAQLAHRI